ncbi:MAG TPA: cytochrome b [Luteimonas sp.]|nr:cytochrome b [Luteimonas sp.]
MTGARNATRWGAVSQAMHWLIVLLVIAMAALGLTMVELPNTPFKLKLYNLHKSIGLTIFALMLLRLAWRAYAGAPPPVPGTPTWQARAASLTHGLLYALLFAMPVSGWVVNAASGFPLHWFGLFRVPQFGGRDDALHALAKGWHEWLFWALVVLALAHAFAAVWHHLFRGDATLARMLPRGWLEEDPQ